MRACLALCLLVLGCGERDAAPPREDAGVGRRVFDPPPRKVRAVPPYGISATGIGQYQLGAPLRDVLALLPHGPRVELLQIERLVDFSVVRTDGDKLVLGANRSAKVGFVAALAPGIARTEHGVEVGVPVADADRAFGERLLPGVVADPRLVRYASMPTLRLVLDGDRIAALLVAPPPEATEPVRPRRARCPPRDEPASELIAAARVATPGARLLPGCFAASGGGEVLVVSGDDVAVVGGEAGRPRRLAGDGRADLAFAGPLDIDGDGRHEIVLVRRQREPDLVIRVEVLALDGGRLVPRTPRDGEEVYRVAPPAAAWIGAKPRELDLLVEVGLGPDGLSIGGLFVRRGGAGLRDVAPLSEVAVAVPRGKRRSAGEPAAADATGPDAGPPAAGADAGP